MTDHLIARPLAAAIALALATQHAAGAPAPATLPTGHVAGPGTRIEVMQSGGERPAMVVKQLSDKAIIDWETFSIGSQGAVTFQQPQATSVALNRVSSGRPSEIFGALASNGKVFLVNQSGILFGPTASVQVGSLVASTLDMANDDFLAASGQYRFGPAGITSTVGHAGMVSNEGSLNAAQQGIIALLGTSVSNTGTITANMGTVALAAGGKVTLDFGNAGAPRVVVSAATVDAMVDNGGAIVADDGQIVMSAQAAGDMVTALVRHTGTLQARSLVARDNSLYLDAGATGAVAVSGTLDVSGTGAGARGGVVRLTGNTVHLQAGATIDARGDAGGGAVGIDASDPSPEPGAPTLTMDRAASIDAGATGNGNGGKIDMVAVASAALGGAASARGAGAGSGGTVTTKATNLALAGFRVDGSAGGAGGANGQWLLLTNPAAFDDALVSSIGHALDRNTDTVLSTYVDAYTPAPASLLVSQAIRKTTAGSARLAMHAGGDIVLGPGVTIGASNAGAMLDVDLHGSAIVLAPGSAIVTNGGSIGLYGANAHARGTWFDGVLIDQAVLDTRAGQRDTGAGGSVTVRGQGATGAIDRPAGSGIVLLDGAIHSASGAIDLAGTGATGTRLAMGAGTGITTTSGAVSVSGIADAPGEGRYGLWLRGAISAGGPLALTGLALGSAPVGLRLDGASLRTTGGASIGILGRGATAAGVELHDVALSTVAGAAGQGNVVIAGESAAASPGVRFDGVRIGGAGMAGTVSISALNQPVPGCDCAPMLAAGAAANAIATAGVINFRPGGVSVSGAVTEAHGVPITVGTGAAGFQVDLPAFGIGQGSAARVVVGSSEHTGTITWAGATPVNGSLALQNDGAGSSGIVLATALQASGVVTLSSGGAVAGNQRIASDGLLLHGTQVASTFRLTNPANAVNRVAALFDGAAAAANPGSSSVDLANAGALAIGPLHGDGFNTVRGEATTFDAATSNVGGNFLVRTSGPLALAHNVASSGGNITLVTGAVLDNAAGRILAPAATGIWQVFADTWTGEVRGGLAGTPPQPNLYHCAYGAACGANPLGNRFVYRAQPTVTLTGAAQSRIYGDANPALAYTVTGLVNGDLAGMAFDGAYATAATIGANVGAYGTTGTFTSPAGYLVHALPGTLTIARAPLLVTAADQAKVYGAADPLLTASFAGLKAGDTGAVLAGLHLAAPAGAAATAGVHAITPSGEGAGNYVIAYVAGRLTVAPAVLSYLAAPATWQAGVPRRPPGGSVTGFVYGDDIASATTGTLTFSTTATPASPAGAYPMQGSGLTAVNYVFVQAPRNATALVLSGPALGNLPAIDRDVTFDTTSLYANNIGTPGMCVATASRTGSAGGEKDDPLAMEWSRVKVSPNLSNCLNLGQRNSCQDF
jgi:filamentous hemagglutinin family protein